MSTRSNVEIIDSNTGDKEYLYRHFDGYISGAGVELMNCIRLMNMHLKKNGIKIADVATVKDWILKSDAFEDTDGIHGDVEYIYQITVDNGDVTLKAFTTKMFAGKDNEAIKQNDVTDELKDEWKSYCEEYGISNVEPEPCSKKPTHDITDSFRDRVKSKLDSIWLSEIRDTIVDEIVATVEEQLASK